MRRFASASQFRSVARIEEDMMRFVMPRTSEADTTPFTYRREPVHVVAPQPLTFRLSEVAR